MGKYIKDISEYEDAEYIQKVPKKKSSDISKKHKKTKRNKRKDIDEY